MITPERVYEVFGITPGPWDITVTVNGFPDGPFLSFNKNNNDTSKTKTNWLAANGFPEMLVALVHELEQLWHDGVEDETGNYIPMVKAVESADSKDRPWSKILKELLK